MGKCFFERIFFHYLLSLWILYGEFAIIIIGEYMKILIFGYLLIVFFVLRCLKLGKDYDAFLEKNLF